MAIKLSNLTFTDEDDIVPASALEQILNTEVANTLAVDDIIIGTGNDYGLENVSVLSTDDGNDIINGIENLEPEFDSSYGLVNSGTLDADDDNDIITGIEDLESEFDSSYGLVNSVILDADDDNDIITGIEDLESEFDSSYGLVNSGILDADDDNDIITGTSRVEGLVNSGTLNTDEGRDILTGTASNHYRSFGTLIINRIKCLKNGADRFGPDDTYITINGKRVWGDYNMKRGRTRSVNHYSKRDLNNPNNWGTPTNSNPVIELFDLDNSWSADELMGRFAPGDTFGMERKQQVRGNGSIYEVYYSYTRSLELW
jgi:hypothetical protein